MIKTASVKEKSRDEPAVHVKRLAFMYHSLSSRGSYWDVAQFQSKTRKEAGIMYF